MFEFNHNGIACGIEIFTCPLMGVEIAIIREGRIVVANIPVNGRSADQVIADWKSAPVNKGIQSLNKRLKPTGR